MPAANLPFYEVDTHLTSSIAPAEPTIGLVLMALGITTYACCLWLRRRGH